MSGAANLWERAIIISISRWGHDDVVWRDEHRQQSGSSNRRRSRRRQPDCAHHRRGKGTWAGPSPRNSQERPHRRRLFTIPGPPHLSPVRALISRLFSAVGLRRFLLRQALLHDCWCGQCLIFFHQFCALCCWPGLMNCVFFLKLDPLLILLLCELMCGFGARRVYFYFWIAFWC